MLHYFKKMNRSKEETTSTKSFSSIEFHDMSDLKLTENDNEILVNKMENDSKVDSTNEESNLKLTLQTSLNKIENLANELNLRIKEFPLVQYEHFSDVKRDIDIKREVKIERLYKKSIIDNKEIENLNKTSIDLIKQIENLEELFKTNFERQIQPKLIEIGIEIEKKTVDAFLKIPNSTKEFLENLIRLYDVKWRNLQKNYQTFDLFEFDLKRNRFIETTEDSLGKLELFQSFISLKDIIDVITCSNDCNQIQVLNLNKNSTKKRLVGHSKGIFCLVPHSKDKIFSGGYDGQIKEFDLITGECLKTLEGHSHSVTCLKVLKSGNLASSSNGGSIKIWDLTKDICIYTLNESSDSDVECLDQLPNGNLISGSDNGIIGIYDLEKRECLKTINDSSNWIKCLKVLPQNDLFATGGKNIKIWNYLSGKCIKILKGHSALICGLELSSNNLLFSCSWDKTVRMWDLISNEFVKEFLGHTDKVTCIKLSTNNDKVIYSVSEDKTLKIWDLDSKECLQTIQLDLKNKPPILSCVNPCFVLNNF